ncbi:hypothetical protein WR25_07598 [Diploscapter pachys]|uniref:Homeobox domain-containing protein n=1 Tax=Diploscapter pachys TaxID=2018661 RepID=A0A2A2LQZ6_9BILA|nr:hypothetical protein WR25_07598 [Diploscapter pachys]
MPMSVESPVVLPPAHTPPSESSMELDPASSIASRHDDEVTVAAAIAADKTRLRQQSAMYDKVLDKWLAHHNQNLYPSREEKEKLAVEMNISYVQVNRWFANRRRKQTKQRTKAVLNSPASVTPSALPAALTNEVIQRIETPPPSASEPGSASFLSPESLALFAQDRAREYGIVRENQTGTIPRKAGF